LETSEFYLGYILLYFHICSVHPKGVKTPKSGVKKG
jgi:hypothetical protein